MQAGSLHSWITLHPSYQWKWLIVRVHHSGPWGPIGIHLIPTMDWCTHITSTLVEGMRGGAIVCTVETLVPLAPGNVNVARLQYTAHNYYNYYYDRFNKFIHRSRWKINSRCQQVHFACVSDVHIPRNQEPRTRSQVSGISAKHLL